MSLGRDRVATSVLFFANGFGFGGWSAAIAPMRAELGLSDAGLGLLLFTFAAGAVASMPIAGLFAPKLGGSGRVSAAAGLAYAALFSGAAMAPNVATLACVGVGLGASNGVMDVAMNAHASGVEQRWRTPIMSSFHAAFSVGGLVGAGVGAACLGLHLDWRRMLVAISALAVALVIGATLGLTEGERPKPSQTPFGWPPRTLIGLALVALLCFMVEGAMIDWDGVYLVSLGAAPAAAPLGYAAFAATMIVGRLTGDRIVARLGRRATIVAGSALAAAGLALAAGVPVLVAAALGFALVGAGLSNVVPALFSESASHASSAARGIAAVATAGYAGLLGGPPLVGAVASLADLRIALAGLAALALAACGAALATR